MCIYLFQFLAHLKYLKTTFSYPFNSFPLIQDLKSPQITLNLFLIPIQLILSFLLRGILLLFLKLIQLLGSLFHLLDFLQKVLLFHLLFLELLLEGGFLLNLLIYLNLEGVFLLSLLIYRFLECVLFLSLLFHLLLEGGFLLSLLNHLLLESGFLLIFSQDLILQNNFLLISLLDLLL